MSIMLGNAVVAGANIVGVRGSAAIGVHRISLRIEFKATQHVPKDGLRLVGTNCRVSLRRCDGDLDLADLTQDGAPHIALFPDSLAQGTFSTVLSRSRLEAIEQLRAGEALHLVARVNGTVVPKGDLPWGFEDSLEYRPKREDWLLALEAMGYQKSLLIDIPLPEALPSAAGLPFGYVNQARTALLEGRWRESVAACRDVLESMRNLLPGGDDPAEAKQVAEFLGRSHNWDKNQRFMALRKALALITHAAKHADEVTAKIDWDRVDAQAVVTMTALTLLRAQTMHKPSAPE